MPPVPEPCTQSQPQARAPAGHVVPRGHSFPAAWPAGPRWAVRGDSCSGLRFPTEPASGLATSSVPCDPVVARRGFLGWSAGLSSQCLSNRLPPGGQWRKSIAKKQKQASCLPAVKLFMALEAAAWTAAYPGPGSARVVLGPGHGQGGLCLPWGQRGEMDAGDPRARTEAEDASGRRRGISGRRRHRGWCGLGGTSRFEPRPSRGGA